MEMPGHSSHLCGLGARTDPSPVSDGTNWCPGAGKARPGEKARVEGRGTHAKLGPSPHISDETEQEKDHVLSPKGGGDNPMANFW